LDCALTYRLREEVPTGIAPVERVERELETEEWKTVLDKAWAAGIPHIVFTGGEPTLREDLLELIEYAEGHGQVTGLMTDGLRLARA
jgi:MoaA/NifB/PqqE/SkfB family radical SAM enzyme